MLNEKLDECGHALIDIFDWSICRYLISPYLKDKVFAAGYYSKRAVFHHKMNKRFYLFMGNWNKKAIVCARTVRIKTKVWTWCSKSTSNAIVRSRIGQIRYTNVSLSSAVALAFHGKQWQHFTDVRGYFRTSANSYLSSFVGISISMTYYVALFAWVIIICRFIRIQWIILDVCMVQDRYKIQVVRTCPRTWLKTAKKCGINIEWDELPDAFREKRIR